MPNLEEKVCEFRSTFSKEAKCALNHKDYILEYCLRNRAWKDTVIRERFDTNSPVIKNKDAIIEILKAQIKNNATEICTDYDAWHLNMCRRTDHGMRFGLWQKFINMTFKNLYCVKELFPEYSSIWEHCHCPIDTIIAKQIYLQLKDFDLPSAELELSYKIANSDKEVNWNYISENQYILLRNQINVLCKDKQITPLEFDFLYWRA